MMMLGYLEIMTRLRKIGMNKNIKDKLKEINEHLKSLKSTQPKNMGLRTHIENYTYLLADIRYKKSLV